MKGVKKMDLQMLIDEREITQKLYRYVGLLDKREFELLGDIFAEDVVFDYAEGVDRKGIDALKAILVTFIGGCGPTQHIAGCPIVEVNGDTATSSVKVQARHEGKGEKSGLNYDAHGNYHDKWIRTIDGWKVVRRDVEATVQFGDPTVLGQAPVISK